MAGFKPAVNPKPHFGKTDVAMMAPKWRSTRRRTPLLPSTGRQPEHQNPRDGGSTGNTAAARR